MGVESGGHAKGRGVLAADGVVDVGGVVQVRREEEAGAPGGGARQSVAARPGAARGAASGGGCLPAGAHPQTPLFSGYFASWALGVGARPEIMGSIAQAHHGNHSRVGPFHFRACSPMASGPAVATAPGGPAAAKSAGADSDDTG